MLSLTCRLLKNDKELHEDILGLPPPSRVASAACTDRYQLCARAGDSSHIRWPGELKERVERTRTAQEDESSATPRSGRTSLAQVCVRTVDIASSRPRRSRAHFRDRSSRALSCESKPQAYEMLASDIAGMLKFFGLRHRRFGWGAIYERSMPSIAPLNRKDLAGVKILPSIRPLRCAPEAWACSRRRWPIASCPSRSRAGRHAAGWPHHTVVTLARGHTNSALTRVTVRPLRSGAPLQAPSERRGTAILEDDSGRPRSRHRSAQQGHRRSSGHHARARHQRCRARPCTVP